MGEKKKVAKVVEAVKSVEETEVVRAALPAEQVEVKVAVPQLLPVIPLTNFRTYHAGKWYAFTKDEEQRVPADLRRILRELKKVYL